MADCSNEHQDCYPHPTQLLSEGILLMGVKRKWKNKSCTCAVKIRIHNRTEDPLLVCINIFIDAV